MKTKGFSANALNTKGAIGLICGLLLLTAFQITGKHARQRRANGSPVVASRPTRTSADSRNPRWSEAYGKLPLSFVENQGQSAKEVRFVSHGTGYELFLTPQEAVLALPPTVPRDLSPRHRTAYIRALRKARQHPGTLTAIRLHLESANPEPQVMGTNPLPGRVNYFIGNDPKKWHTGVPSYGCVKYAGIYPGVDLVFYGAQRRLEYDFVVAPGANPRAIALKVDGAQKVRSNSHGDLVLSVAGGAVMLQKPVVYQNVKGERREIAARYVVDGGQRITFAVGTYDHSQPLISIRY